MAFTPKDREALRKARIAVAELEIQETAALADLSHAMIAAGLELGEGVEWADVAESADAIRDALEPFDSGVRHAPEVAR